MNLKDLKNVDKTQILEMLGLEEKSSTTSNVLQSLGLIGVGAIVGAAITLLFAPKEGRELRQDIKRRITSATDGIGHARDKSDVSQTAGA